MDAISVALPIFLFSSLSALPLALGALFAIRHLRAGSRSAYYKNLAASIGAGAAALTLLWSSMFGDNLSRSSTAGLIFAVAPFYAAIVQGIVYGIAAAIFRKSAIPRAIPAVARLAVVVPLLMLAVLLSGLVKTSFEGNESAIAERTSDARKMHQMLAKSRTGELDTFSIPMHLAQNPNAPADLLSELASHEHAVVRAHVASHPNTPVHIVAALRYDCASFVRKAVVERLGPASAPEPAPAPTGFCAQERWR